MAGNSGPLVLIADDDPQAAGTLVAVLQSEGYAVVSTTKGGDVYPTVVREDPDVVLLDYRLPDRNGMEVLEEIKRSEKTAHTPVVMITGSEDRGAEEKALALGADDFVRKPPRIPELRARVKSLVKVKGYYDELQVYQAELEQKVAERTRALEEAMTELRKTYDTLWSASYEVTFRLARAAEFKDEDTGSHIRRMSLYAALIARELDRSGGLSEQIFHAAAMHDVGKIGVPDRVLLKPGKLTTEEWRIMQTHTTLGAQILSASRYPLVELGASIARSHHEKWDGSGYPDGLRGKEIPEAARIVAVADVFDALTSRRPYKEPFSFERSVSIIRQGSGTHFDPEVARAFLSVLPLVKEVMAENTDGRESYLHRVNPTEESPIS